MQTTLENRKKALSNSLRSAFNKMKKVKEGGTFGSKVKRE
jgi:hypothetical protein